MRTEKEVRSATYPRRLVYFAGLRIRFPVNQVLYVSPRKSPLVDNLSDGKPVVQLGGWSRR
jgi:hypothetical protein